MPDDKTYFLQNQFTLIKSSFSPSLMDNLDHNKVLENKSCLQNPTFFEA